MKGNLHCIGAAKAGTTWLYSQLQKSKDFYFAPEKEIHYYFTKYGDFNRLNSAERFKKLKFFFDLASTNYRNVLPEREFYNRFFFFQKNLDWYENFARGPVTDSWYRSLFRDADNDQWVCDFSPSTSKISISGVEALKGSGDNVKLIYMLRDPTDRLWSHIKFHASWQNRLDEVMEMTLEEKISFVSDYGLLSDGMYGEIIEKFLKVFDRDDILLVDFEMIKRDPHSVLAEVGDFLGVDKPLGDKDISKAINPGDPKPIENEVCMAFSQQISDDLLKLQSYGFKPADKWLDRIKDASE